MITNHEKLELNFLRKRLEVMSRQYAKRQASIQQRHQREQKMLEVALGSVIESTSKRVAELEAKAEQQP